MDFVVVVMNVVVIVLCVYIASDNYYSIQGVSSLRSLTPCARAAITVYVISCHSRAP